MIEAIGDDAFYNWIVGYKPNGTGGYVADTIPASNIIKTSGSATDVNPVDGQTEQRKAFSYKDLQSAQALMDKQSVSKLNRFATLESYQKQQFIDSLSFNQMAVFLQSADLANGIANFNILDRSSVLSFAADGTPIVPSQVMATDGNIGSLCWQQDSVATAPGDIVNFEKLKDPQYYGDIFPALVKFGGRCRREDWKGVVAIVQGTV